MWIHGKFTICRLKPITSVLSSVGPTLLIQVLFTLPLAIFNASFMFPLSEIAETQPNALFLCGSYPPPQPPLPQCPLLSNCFLSICLGVSVQHLTLPLQLLSPLCLASLPHRLFNWSTTVNTGCRASITSHTPTARVRESLQFHSSTNLSQNMGRTTHDETITSLTVGACV